MQDDHFAVLIGISNYPGFTKPPANLLGPENDVDAVRDWLLADAGGGLPALNITTIRSSAFPPNSKAPNPVNLEDAFFWLEGLAQASMDAGNGKRVGRRLYLYMSGHGVSSAAREACLLTANAVPRQTTANICANAWLRFFKTSNYFDEFVLVFDACMDRATTVVPTPAPLADVVEGGAAGPSFEAFAAVTPLKTVEMAVPEHEGKFHGVFTWAFLDGLRGAAATRLGTVTGESMATWLRAALRGRLSQSDLDNPEISKEPEIQQESARLILAQGVKPLTFATELRFPDQALGQPARIWSGAPPKPVDFVASPLVMMDLTAGLHLVEVPAAGLRHGFAVTGARARSIADTGSPVAAPADGVTFALNLQPADRSTTTSVEDHRFEVIGGFPGNAMPLEFGLYRAQFRAGQGSVERVFVLDRDIASIADLTAWSSDHETEAVAGAVEVPIQLPRIPSAVPFLGGGLSHEYHAAHLRVPRASAADAPKGNEGEIYLVARSWTVGGRSLGAKPWQDVTVLGPRGKVVIDLTAQGQLDERDDPIAACRMTLPAGAYVLRYPMQDGVLTERSVIVSPGWRSEAYLLKLDASAPLRYAALMHESGSHIDPDRQRDEQFEAASAALATGAPIRREALLWVLDEKYDNPIQGIIGAHLMLAQGIQASLPYDQIITNLRNLVGHDHPDVEALSLQCTDPDLRARKPFRAPPIYARSWDLMIKASQSNPGLVPLSLWNRVSAQSMSPPYFSWAADSASRRGHMKALRAAADRYVRQAPASSSVKESVTLESIAPVPPSIVEFGTLLDRPFGPGSRAFTEAVGSETIRSGTEPQVGRIDLPRPSHRREQASGRPSGPTAVEAFARSNNLPPSALAALMRKPGA